MTKAADKKEEAAILHHVGHEENASKKFYPWSEGRMGMKALNEQVLPGL